MKAYITILLVISGFISLAPAELVYESFESYTPGAEGGGGSGDLWMNWAPAMSGDHPAPGNPFLTPYIDTAVSYSGSYSMMLEAPLLVWDDTAGEVIESNAGWGVIIRDDGSTMNLSDYNVMTAMVKSNGITGCRFIVRDSANGEVGNDLFDVPNDGNWHKISVLLDGPGAITAVQRILPFFSGVASGATGTQLWIDDIKFDTVKTVNDILSVSGAGGPVGGTANYSFVMTEQPSGDVTFTLTPAEQLDLGEGLGMPVDIVFTNADWDSPQVLSVAITDQAAPGIVDVAVSASSAVPEYDQAVDGGFTVPILGPYGAFYVISPETPFWGSPTAPSGDSGNDLANGEVASNFYVPIDAGIADLVEWAPSAYGAGTPAYAEITFDFGYVKDVSTIDIYYAAGTYPPGDFEISYSDDNETFSTPQVYPPYIGGPISRTHIANETPVAARYVKLIVHCIDDDPGKWFFLSEVEFNAPVPERVPPFYTIDENNIPAGRNPDPDQNKLFNGVISYAAASSDYVFFERFDNTPYDNVILYADYGRTREFSNLVLNYFAGWGVSAPVEAKLSFSDDGETYGAPVTFTGWHQGTEGGGKTDARSFSTQKGRYVKMEFARDTGTSHALRLGEIILGNRKEVSYTVDASTPVWGGGTAASGDVAVEAGLELIKMGDLTNGYIAKAVGVGLDPDWVEWAPGAVGASTPAYALITFDLGSVINVKNVAIVYCSNPGSGIQTPGGLEAAFSTDGTNFSGMADTGAVFSENQEEAEIFNSTFDLPDTDARYVTLKIKCQDDDPDSWFFISEVKFNSFASDFNDEGIVDSTDLYYMAGEWLQSGENLAADIAGDDQSVNLLDFSLLCAEWLGF
ncbi:F5/8 type C domain protein [Limihaloglobus sulfuriphilus]|uniref:F5/8 type C domain protein n=1 Tax=Limihaloglobus sulfuriphilus TaxID=1851148 RepID=A0A1Q2MH42_9BACT|nr:discoidin domain-containing protein [Limihaloglobus sulfuriphilus]AQQ71969.1 F5/8 type C domain protein [Limihaloglobus sulfuriphilus]